MSFCLFACWSVINFSVTYQMCWTFLDFTRLLERVSSVLDRNKKFSPNNSLESQLFLAFKCSIRIRARTRDNREKLPTLVFADVAVIGWWFSASSPLLPALLRAPANALPRLQSVSAARAPKIKSFNSFSLFCDYIHKMSHLVGTASCLWAALRQL